MKKIKILFMTVTIMLLFVLSANAAYYESEDNNSYANADVISQQCDVKGTINDGSDNDYYKIVPTSNGKISIDFCHSYVGNGRRWLIYVYKFENGEYIELSCTGVALNAKEIISLPFIGAVNNEAYYIRVKTDGWNDVVGHPYTLKISFEKSDYYEREINNNYAGSTKVTLNKSYTGILNKGDDNDYYKIVPTSNGKISIDFCHSYADNGRRWLIYIYKYDNGEYKELSCTGVALKDKETINLPFIGAVKNEEYYIRVKIDGWEDVVGHQYTLKTSYEKSEYYEREINNNYAGSTKVTLNKSYTGILNKGDDNDYYKIVPTSNGKISIDFCHSYADNGRRWLIYIYKYDNGEYKELSCTGVALKDKETINLPFIGAVKNEEYYIRVKIDGWEDVVGHQYTLKTSLEKSNYFEHEINNSYNFATTVVANKTYVGTVNSSGDNDYYKFVAPGTGTLAVNFMHNVEDNGRGWKIEMYKYDNGEYIRLSESYVNLNSAKNYELPSIGTSKKATYYVRVTINGWDDVVSKEYSLKFIYNISDPTDLKYSYSTSAIKLAWDKVSGATGYKVYKYDTKKKKYVEIANTKKTSYKESNLKAGTEYKYAVRAYTKVDGVTYYSSYVKITTATSPAQVTNLKVTSSNFRTCVVSYSKVSGATGYQIYYSTSKNGTYKKLATTSKTKYTDKKFGSRRTYYIKVRAYKKVSGKTVYGAFSTVKSVKIK